MLVAVTEVATVDFQTRLAAALASAAARAEAAASGAEVISTMVAEKWKQIRLTIPKTLKILNVKTVDTFTLQDSVQ